MHPLISNAFRTLLKHFDIGITKLSTLQELTASAKAADDMALLLALPPAQAATVLTYLGRSKSQFRQDLFALSELNFKRNGFFVEFGATNGIDLSNSYLLEKEFGWNGILAEPAACWHAALRANRSAHIETECVWQDSNSTLVFNEVANAELSTIDSYSARDKRRNERQRGRTYAVKTISLLDMLDKYAAPPVVDFLSVDTEGSEYDILRAFDFDKYQFNVIVCEHNHTAARERIFMLLTQHGYVRRLEQLSKVDDWYVRQHSSRSDFP